MTAVLGEGPYWLPEESALLWVDIAGGLLHRTEFPSGETVSAEIEQVSAVFPAGEGALVYAARHRVVLRQPVPGQAGLSGEYTELELAAAPARPDVRFNDGSVDPAGRVWVGTMHTAETQPLGTLYRLDANAGTGGVLTPVGLGATVSNGLGWSPDGSRLYYADSPTRRVDVFDYDQAHGVPGRRRMFTDLSGAGGFPDGLTVDLDGYVWVAMWDGGVLRRFAPDGELDAVIPVPVRRPTSMAFGGPGMTDLLVTTASIELSPSERRAQPLAGRLLRLRPGPVGLPSTTTRALVPAF
ncbi:MAG TPA: SMP-30/gluconolactonase/LRE family protein [Trebonia sp.]|nr:SMP-30/gluconolactonase/LRE family protein [Trebonia sp.]